MNKAWVIVISLILLVAPAEAGFVGRAARGARTRALIRTHKSPTPAHSVQVHHHKKSNFFTGLFVGWLISRPKHTSTQNKEEGKKDE